MKKIAVCFFIVFFISIFNTIALASSGEKNTEKDSSKNFPDNFKNIFSPQKQSLFSTKRPKIITQKLISSTSAETDSDIENKSFNPDTGWHTVNNAEILNYRGTRKVITDESFKVCYIKSEKTKDNSVLIEIHFNQEINPKSFSSYNLKINGKTVDSNVKFSFSRKGDSVKIQIPAQQESFSISLINIQTFDGEKIQEIHLGKISAE